MHDTFRACQQLPKSAMVVGWGQKAFRGEMSNEQVKVYLQNWAVEVRNPTYFFTSINII